MKKQSNQPNQTTKVNISQLSRSELEQEVVRLQTEKASLELRLNWMEEQYRLSRHKQFGASSEKTLSEGQLVLPIFNDAEAEAVLFHQEPTLEIVTSYKRKKQKGHKAKLLAKLPKEVIEYRLSETQQICDDCGNGLHEVRTEIRQELKIIPPQVSVVEHVQYLYTCRYCQEERNHSTFIKASMPNPVLKKSLVSPSMMAYVMARKYVDAMPLYRQEQDFKRLSLQLSRATLSNWMLHGAKDWLLYLYQRMHTLLLEKDVLHADETELEVLCEPDRPAKTKSYMWMYRTSGCDEAIVLYDYQPGRSGDNPRDFLKTFHGYLHVDGYAGYHKVGDTTLVGCFAHARRKFTDCLKALPKGQSMMSVNAGKGKDYCDQLFKLEKQMADLTSDERYRERLIKSQPIIDEFFNWIAIEKLNVLPKSSYGKAINYCFNQREKLKAFLLDGRLELSNNRAERAIKSFVIGRKNWLFSNTPRGANASAIIYSIIETAKENNLNPFEYLTYLFERLPNEDTDDMGVLDSLMPWSEALPERCKVQNH